MNYILAACLGFAVLACLTAGCVVSPQSDPGTVDEAGNILFGDAANGRMIYADGTVETWSTDAKGNTNHTIVEKDGTTYGYMITSDGTIIIS
ncbi:MAG: hypothetical protein Q4Q04_00025 [Methanocorpusculum sp.]|nr:hypothetical protein [Methanocorpusculum sp.]